MCCIPVPRFCRRSLVRISSNLACVLSLGSLTWTPPRRPVPKLEGQVRTKPRWSFHMNPWLCFLKVSSICQRRAHTWSCVADNGGVCVCIFSCVFLLPSEDQRRSAWTLPSCFHPAAWKWLSGDPPRSPRPRRSCSHCACVRQFIKTYRHTFFTQFCSRNVIFLLIYALNNIVYLCSVLSLTRCLWHRASHGPFRQPAAGGRRVCQTGSGQRSAAPARHQSWTSGGSIYPWTLRPRRSELEKERTYAYKSLFNRKSAMLAFVMWLISVNRILF